MDIVKICIVFAIILFIAATILMVYNVIRKLKADAKPSNGCPCQQNKETFKTKYIGEYQEKNKKPTGKYLAFMKAKNRKTNKAFTFNGVDNQKNRDKYLY